jgi:hypothetical protein
MTKKLKKFRVWVKVTSYCYLDVEATHDSDALRIAGETDGGEFVPVIYGGGWDIDRVEEL